MSRFFSSRYASLKPYVPGEQPADRRYVKLNTNELPFPPSKAAVEYASAHVRTFELYNDPEAVELRTALAEHLRLPVSQVTVTNGSDQMLHFAMAAFADESRPAVFPDISYGFYRVYADLVRVPYEEVPLDDSFRIRCSDYAGKRAVIFLANPNAPTGIALTRFEIEGLLRSVPDSVVVVDEAYVDFGGESAVPLIEKYQNLVVVGTFSKSRSMAGARLGYGAAQEALMRDLQTVRYSMDPYNVNSYTQALGIGVLKDERQVRENCSTIIKNRAFLTEGLRRLRFEVLPSSANFVFARSYDIGGKELYEALKERGILIRHFDRERIKDYNRITVGTMEQISLLLNAVRDIVGG